MVSFIQIFIEKNQVFKLNSDSISTKPPAQILFETGKSEFDKARFTEALGYFQKAHELAPQNLQCLAFISMAYEQLNQLESGLEYARKILAIDPQSGLGHFRVGLISVQTHDYDAAITHLEKARKIEPENNLVLNDLGFALLGAGYPQRAIPHFQQVIDTHPYTQVYENMAVALGAIKDINGSIEHYRKANELYFKERGALTKATSVHLGRLIHDYEQIQYIKDHDIIGNEYDLHIKHLHEIIDRAQQNGIVDREAMVQLSAEESSWIAPFFDKNIHIGDGSVITGGTLNPDISTEEIEQQFYSSDQKMLYIDGLLTEEALQKLYKFCLESTIFRRKYSGYFGATLASGLAVPLILQVSEDLQNKFPGIYKNYPLAQAWAFKHDHDMPGVNIHADFGSIQTNIWLTPNKANLDSETGGLVVWDKEAPPDWSFSDYQSNSEKEYEYLKQSNANSIRIPYKQNRTSVFSSALFHVTDNPKFRQEYENRRINLTFTYGRSLRL